MVPGMTGNRTNLTIPPELEAEMTPAVRAFVLSLFDVIRTQQQRIDELETKVTKLEARLGKTPENSSLPPSSQHPHVKPKPRRKPSGRKRGGQKGHPKHERALVPPEDVNETIVLRPKSCRGCGKALSGDDPQPRRHQVFELPEIKPVVTEYQQHRLECSCCRVSTTAKLPDGVPRGQSGPRLIAFTGLLMAYFRQSKRRTTEFLQTLLNTPCSTGLTVKHQNITTDALQRCYDELADALPKVDAANLDETATKEANQKAWLWVAATRRFTLFAARRTRSASVVRELMGEHFGGVITCDRYAGYDHCPRRQLCWAHLKRDFQAMIDRGGAAMRIGKRLMKATCKLFRHWQRYRDGTIVRATLRRNIHRLKYRVWEALEAGMRCRHQPTAGTCGHLFDRFDHLWTFAEHADVEPTNNVAERALRHAVIWRKLSFGTQSESGSRFVETLLSVIETCRQQGRGVFAFMTKAVSAHFKGQAAPTLLDGV